MIAKRIKITFPFIILLMNSLFLCCQNEPIPTFNTFHCAKMRVETIGLRDGIDYGLLIDTNNDYIGDIILKSNNINNINITNLYSNDGTNAYEIVEFQFYSPSSELVAIYFDSAIYLINGDGIINGNPINPTEYKIVLNDTSNGSLIFNNGSSFLGNILIAGIGRYFFDVTTPQWLHDVSNNFLLLSHVGDSLTEVQTNVYFIAGLNADNNPVPAINVPQIKIEHDSNIGFYIVNTQEVLDILSQGFLLYICGKGTPQVSLVLEGVYE